MTPDEFRSFTAFLIRYLLRIPPPIPRQPRVTNIRRKGTEMPFAIDLNLPPADPSGGTVKRHLHIAVNGGEATTKELAGEATTDTIEPYEEHDMLSVTLADIDQAGNESEPSPALDFEVVEADTTPPPVPGAPGIAAIRPI